MLRKISKLAISLVARAVFAPLASAHNLFLEPQTLDSQPWQSPGQGDFSFSAPFVIDNVIDSQAIFSYLTAGDVDVFEFEITQEDLTSGPVLVSASALPPPPAMRQRITTQLPR